MGRIEWRAFLSSNPNYGACGYGICLVVGSELARLPNLGKLIGNLVTYR